MIDKLLVEKGPIRMMNIDFSNDKCITFKNQLMKRNMKENDLFILQI